MFSVLVTVDRLLGGTLISGELTEIIVVITVGEPADVRMGQCVVISHVTFEIQKSTAAMQRAVYKRVLLFGLVISISRFGPVVRR